MNIHNDFDMDVLNLDNCNISQNSRVSNDSFVSFTLEVNDNEISNINNNTEMLSLDLYGPKEIKKNPKYQNLRINENFELDKVLTETNKGTPGQLYERNSSRSNDKVFRINRNNLQTNEENSKQISLNKIQKNLNALAESKIMINAKRPSFFTNGSPMGMNSSFTPFNNNSSIYGDLKTNRQAFKIKDITAELSFNNTTNQNQRGESIKKNPIKKNANYDLIATKTMPQKYDNEKTIYKNNINTVTGNNGSLKTQESKKPSKNNLHEEDSKYSNNKEPFQLSPKNKGSLNQSIQEKLKIIYSKASLDQNKCNEQQNLFGSKKTNYPKHRLESHRDRTLSKSRLNHEVSRNKINHETSRNTLKHEISKNNINMSRETFIESNRLQSIPGRNMKISEDRSKSRNIEFEQNTLENKVRPPSQLYARNYFKNNYNNIEKEGNIYASVINNSKNSIGIRENSAKTDADDYSMTLKNKFFAEQNSNTNNYHLTNQVPNKFALKLNNYVEGKKFAEKQNDKSLSILESNRMYLNINDKNNKDNKKNKTERSKYFTKKNSTGDTKPNDQSNNKNNYMTALKAPKNILYQSQQAQKGFLKNLVKKVSTNIYLDQNTNNKGYDNNSKFKQKKKMSIEAIGKMKPYLNNKIIQNDLSQKSRRHIYE